MFSEKQDNAVREGSQIKRGKDCRSPARRASVARTERSDRSRPNHTTFAVHPRRFIFSDRRTGALCFEVKAGRDGSMPMEQAASLVAVHCLSHNQDPGDFTVTVSVGENLMSGLVSRATKLLHSCPGSRPPRMLSRRQRDVFILVGRNLTNKEIAQRLQISERTVKFHVSSLLDKFGARRRMDLVLEGDRQRRAGAAALLAPGPGDPAELPKPSPVPLVVPSNVAAGRSPAMFSATTR
jgi:DNA-binding CsgD family transcriptional regulator